MKAFSFTFIFGVTMFFYGCGGSNTSTKSTQLEKETAMSSKNTTNDIVDVKMEQESKKLLQEEGSPAHPYENFQESNETNDPNSPKNAKVAQEDISSVPDGHPLKAQKIDKNDPDLQKKGSPANPIVDITGKDITN